jgi:ABC-type transport system substrate-binding protein
VLIGGEEGVGKGRLLEEFETHLVPDDVRVLHGRFVEQQSGFPLHGFCELIQGYFRSKEMGEVSAGLPDFSDLAAELLNHFPVLGEIPSLRAQATQPMPADAPGIGTGDEQTYLFELIARTLTRICNNRPMVLVLEDLHFGNVALKAVQYAVRRLGPTPTLVIGSFCSDDMDHSTPVARLLDSFRGDRQFLSLQLPPLSKSEHTSLLCTLLGGLEVSPELSSRIYETTDGNPFFTIDLIQSLRDFGVLAQNDQGSWFLPEEQELSSNELPLTIQQAVDKRIRNLSPELQGLLRVASILGRTFKYEHLEAISGEALNTDDAVDALLDVGVLSEIRHSREERLAFSSGAVRDVLYASLTRRKRRLHHQRFAEYLEVENSGQAEDVYALLCHHFTQGDAPEKAIEYGLLAARQFLSAFSPEEALRALKSVFTFLEDAESAKSSPLNGRAWMLFSRAHRMKGDAETALSGAEKAVDIYERADDEERLAEAILLAAEIAWESRQISWAEQWVDRGIAVSSDLTDKAVPLELLSLGSTLANLRGDYVRSQEYQRLASRLSTEGAEKQALPDGGRLAIALSNPIRATDPSRGMMIEETEVFATVFETLLETDSRGNLQPLLCESWESSDDGTSFTLTIRDGVTFHDGHQLTAQDVKLSFERVARLAAESTISGAVRTLLDSIKGIATGDAIADSNHGSLEGPRPAHASGLTVLSERQIRFDLNEPLSIFPVLLTQPQTAIVRDPLDATAEVGRVLGTGPFRLSKLSPEHVVVDRNGDYWGEQVPRLDGLDFRTGMSSADTATHLRSGDIDIAHDLLPEDLDKILRDPRLRSRLVEMPDKNTFFLLFNLSGPTASHHAIREVMTRTLRVPDLVWRTLGRFAQPATGLIPPGVLGHLPGRRFPEPISAETAVEMMGAESITRPVYVRAAVHPAFLDRYRALLDALLGAWRELGIEVSVANQDAESFLRLFDDTEGIDLWLGRWVADYSDADNFTFGLFHSRVGVLRNYYCSTEMDALTEQARMERDPTVRHESYLKIERMFRKDDVLIPLFHDCSYRLASPRVSVPRLRSSPPYVNYSELARINEVATPTSRAFANDTLEIPCVGGLRSLDPALSRTLTEFEAISNIYESLTRVTEAAHVAPWLAKEIKPEDDGRSYRIVLRPNVHFHNGRLLTSRDVRYSLERLLRVGGHRGEIMTCIKGADPVIRGEVNELEGFHVVSSSEFVIQLKQPNRLFPLLLSHPTTAIVPESSRAGGREEPGRLPGTGPFKTAQFVPGQRLELEASSEYWREGFPKSAGLVFQLNVPQKEVAEQFRAGRFALATRLDDKSFDELRSDSGFARGFRESPGLSTAMLQFNTFRGPLADEEARRLLTSAIDVLAAVERAAPGALTVANTLVPPALLPQKGATRRARTVIHRPGELSERLTLNAAVLPAPAYFPQVARELFRSLGKLGVRVHTVNDSIGDFFAALETGEVDLIVGRWCAHYPDADSFYHQLYDSQSGYLRKFFCSDKVDELVNLSRGESDPFLRQTTYLELEALLARNAIVLPLFHEPDIHFVQPGIKGFRTTFGYPSVAYEALQHERESRERRAKA